MTAFLSGRDLSRRFYEEAVRPLLAVIQSRYDTAHVAVPPRLHPIVE
jgi:hypothetical protein